MQRATFVITTIEMINLKELFIVIVIYHHSVRLLLCTRF